MPYISAKSRKERGPGAGQQVRVRLRRRQLKKYRLRMVKSVRARCPGVRRRKRFARVLLALAAAGIILWAKKDGSLLCLRGRQVLHVERIEESGPVQPSGDRDGYGAHGARLLDPGRRMQVFPDKTTVKRGFTILLKEGQISIFKVEEGIRAGND